MRRGVCLRRTGLASGSSTELREAAQRLAVTTAQRLAVTTAQRLAVTTAQRLDVTNAQQLAVTTARRLAATNRQDRRLETQGLAEEPRQEPDDPRSRPSSP